MAYEAYPFLDSVEWRNQADLVVLVYRADPSVTYFEHFARAAALLADPIATLPELVCVDSAKIDVGRSTQSSALEESSALLAADHLVLQHAVRLVKPNLVTADVAEESYVESVESDLTWLVRAR